MKLTLKYMIINKTYHNREEWRWGLVMARTVLVCV